MDCIYYLLEIFHSFVSSSGALIVTVIWLPLLKELSNDDFKLCKISEALLLVP